MASGPALLEIHGMAEFQRALKYADRDVRLGVRKEMRQAALPMQWAVEVYTLTRIRRMYRSPKWARMRTGVTQTSVYVAPRQRGVGKGFQPLARPNLAELIRERAMDPAEEKFEPIIRQNFERMLDQMADKFNRSPI